MEKKRLRFFSWFTPRENVVSLVEGLFGICLTAAFVFYHVYVAAGIMVAVLLLLLVYQLRFVIVSETDVRQFHWGHIDMRLPAEEIERIDTKADDKGCMAIIYAQRDVLELPYRQKTLRGVLRLLGVAESVTQRLFDEKSEDFSEESAGFRVVRKTVKLDAFAGKKDFVHRELEKIGERDISG